MANVQPDHNVRTPGPGASSTRTDLSGQKKQPVRVPTGLPYGAASQLKNQEQAVAVPATAQQIPSGPGAAPSGAAPPSAPPDPRDILHAVSAQPTQMPGTPLVPGNPVPSESQNLALKVDALSRAATLPFAGPQIYQMAAQARDELALAQQRKYTSPLMAQV